MHPRYRIVVAQSDHVHALPSIERAASVLLEGYSPAATLTETTPIADFRAAQVDQRLFVALHADTPVGFALATMLAADAPHLHELDVHPAHMRRGVGTALLKTVVAWSRQAGWTALTLTTFRDVPWNAPFYARHGFAEQPPSAWSPALRSRVDDEHARGLDRAQRIVMECSPRTA